MKNLEVKNICSGYGPAEVLHNVDMFVKELEIVSIIGPNGCGKSTLLKTIMGLVPWANGSVTYQGKGILGLQPHEIVLQEISYVPQLANVFSGMKVYENLEIGGYLLDKKVIKERIEEVLSIFPFLKERISQAAGTMSGGERQTLAMGMALMTKPSLLVIDEPSAGLSPIVTDEMFETIKKLPEEYGITVLMVEQDVYGALDISDRAYVLAMGQNEFDGSAQEVLNDEKIRIAYLGG